jgi:hypothetical protein
MNIINQFHQSSTKIKFFNILICFIVILFSIFIYKKIDIFTFILFRFCLNVVAILMIIYDLIKKNKFKNYWSFTLSIVLISFLIVYVINKFRKC